MRFTTQFNAGVAVCLLIETLGPAMANAAEPGGAPPRRRAVVSGSAGRRRPSQHFQRVSNCRNWSSATRPPVLVDEYLVGGSPKSPARSRS